jgi:hypothetical protein
MKMNFKSVNDRLQRLKKKCIKREQDQATEKKRVESRLMRGAVAKGGRQRRNQASVPRNGQVHGCRVSCARKAKSGLD